MSSNSNRPSRQPGHSGRRVSKSKNCGKQRLRLEISALAIADDRHQGPVVTWADTFVVGTMSGKRSQSPIGTSQRRVQPRRGSAQRQRSDSSATSRGVVSATARGGGGTDHGGIRGVSACVLCSGVRRARTGPEAPTRWPSFFGCLQRSIETDQRRRDLRLRSARIVSRRAFCAKPIRSTSSVCATNPNAPAGMKCYPCLGKGRHRDHAAS